MTQKWWVASVAVVGLGCSRGNFSRGGDQDRPLTYPLVANVSTLDPARANEVYIAEALSNVYEGLVAYDDHNQVVPQLAEKWTLEDGGRTYVFKIRTDAKFQNGRAVTAADFKWTLERNLSPAIGSRIAPSYLTDIVGVKDVVAGRTKTLAGVVASDEHTLRITLDRPRAYFLGILTFPCTFVIAREGPGAEIVTKPEQAIGTGPFKISRLIPDQELDLVANDGYYLGRPKVREIRRPVITDPATRLAKYRAGELDMIDLNRADIVAMQADPALKPQLHSYPSPSVSYVGMGQAAYPPFRDRRVRRAFAMAIDRTHIVRDLVSGFVEARGLVPPGVPGHQPDLKGIAYDPAEARRLVQEAGYGPGHPLPPLSVNYPAMYSDNRLVAEGVAASLLANLGIEVRQQPLEMGDLLDREHNRKHQLELTGWVADYLDPQNFLSLLLTSDSDVNRDQYVNREFDRLCHEADVETDSEGRFAKYRRAESLAVEDAARIPIFYQTTAVLENPRISGLRRNLIGYLPHLRTEIVQTK